MVLHHREWLGWIAPTSSISLSEVHTSSSRGRGMRLNHSLKGSLSLMRILCSIALIHPNSLLSNMKISLNARTSSFATAMFLGDQPLRPSKFNFSRSFSCHTDTDIGSCCTSALKAASISGDNFTGGTGVA